MECSRTIIMMEFMSIRSNNTNKWNAQEHNHPQGEMNMRSNNTNKWNAQER